MMTQGTEAIDVMGVTGRRLGNRRETSVAGRVVDKNDCLTDVTVRDLSATGARIEAPFGASLPKTFLFRVPREGLETRAELVWRNGCEAGVRFLSDADAPSLAPATMIAPAARPKVADLRKLVRTVR